MSKQFKSLRTIYISELVLVFAMVLGIIPQEFSYFILILLSVSFLKMEVFESLKLFILSIPFFVALPTNAISDSMSIWRILIVVLFLKICYEKFFPKDIKKSNKSLSTLKSGYQRFRDEILIVKKRKYYKLLILALLFFAFIFGSLFFAEDVSAGVKKMLFLANILLLFPISLFCLRNTDDLIDIIKYLFYSIFIILFVGYFQFGLTFFIPLHIFWQIWTDSFIKVFYGDNMSILLSQSNTWFSYYSSSPPTLRMFSVMPDSHSFAMIIIISIPLLLTLLIQKSISKKIIIWTLILSACAIFFSGTRGVWVGLVLTLFIAILFFVPHKVFNLWSYFSIRKQKNIDIINSKIILYSIILFFIIAPVSFIVLSQNRDMQMYKSGRRVSIDDKFNLFERAKSISDFSEMSNKGRLQIWQETAYSIADKPFLGVGYGNYPFVLNESMSNIKRGSSAHNIYLNIAAELGIFALIVFLLIIYQLLGVSYGLFLHLRHKYLKIFAGSFFIYFVWMSAYGLFDVVIFNDKVLMYLVIMIALVYFISENEKKLKL